MGKTVVSERVLIEAGWSPRAAMERVADAAHVMIDRYAKADVVLDVATLTVVPDEQPGWLNITMDGRTEA